MIFLDQFEKSPRVEMNMIKLLNLAAEILNSDWSLTLETREKIPKNSDGEVL